MISVLGYELSAARALLEAEGFSVTAVETRSRKGVDGDRAMVVRERLEGSRAELVWSTFKTDCEYGG